MNTSSINIGRLGKHALILLSAFLLTGNVGAQDRAKYDAIAAKYKDEHAVYTHVTEQLVIELQDGELTAHSNVSMEKLFISELSLSMYNTDEFWYGDFHQPSNYSGVAYIPNGNKKYKRVECYTFGSGRPYSYEFYDDTRLAEAFYSGLSKNTVTETKYRMEHTDIRMLPTFLFQDGFHSLPIDEAVFEVVVPSYVKMSFAIKGANTSWIKQSKEEKNGNVYYRFTANNIPATKNFDNVHSWRYFLPHVIPYISSYRITGASKDSVLANTTDELYKHQYNFVRSKNFKVDTGISNTVKRITEGDVTESEKAAHIYKWVQDNIHYVAIENGMEGFIPRPADTVYKRKYGDCKDMSSLISAMCQRAGLKAYFAWIGTTDLPYSYKETPIHVSNHMICAVKINNEWVFLDGTHPYLPFGANRDDIQGKETLIAIDQDHYEIVTIPVEAPEKNTITDVTHLTIDGSKLHGSVDQVYKGYGSWQVGAGLLANKKDDDREKMVKQLTMRGTNKYQLSKYNIRSAKSGNRDVTINAEFVLENYLWNTKKETIINMNLLRHFDDLRVDTKDRVVPCFFDYKSKRKEVVVLDIPKGYKVKHLPANSKGSLDDLWNYSITYTKDKGHVTLTKEYELKTLAIGVEKFADNNKMVDRLKNIYKESVVLTTN